MANAREAFPRPDLRSARPSVHDAALRALELAKEIERLLEFATAGASGSDAYTLRIAGAICSSLEQELETIAAPESKGPRSVRVSSAASKP